MNDDRDQVLRQVRSALKSAHLPSSRATIPPRTITKDADRAQMIESFRRELEPLGGMTWIARDDEEGIEAVLRLLKQYNAREILAWADEELHVRGLGNAIRASDIEILDGRVPSGGTEHRARLQELERASVGVTGSLAGLADTGTLALLTSESRSRLASLLPPVHIAVLPVSRLFRSLAAFFAAHPTVTQQGSNLAFVTGPSRTADIELILTRGVHGPRDVHVVIAEHL